MHAHDYISNLSLMIGTTIELNMGAIEGFSAPYARPKDSDPCQEIAFERFEKQRSKEAKTIYTY